MHYLMMYNRPSYCESSFILDEFFKDFRGMGVK